MKEFGQTVFIKQFHSVFLYFDVHCYSVYEKKSLHLGVRKIKFVFLYKPLFMNSLLERVFTEPSFNKLGAQSYTLYNRSSHYFYYGVCQNNNGNSDTYQNIVLGLLFS